MRIPKKISDRVKDYLAVDMPGPRPSEHLVVIKQWNKLYKECLIKGSGPLIEATPELMAVRKINGFWEKMGFRHCK